MTTYWLKGESRRFEIGANSKVIMRKEIMHNPIYRKDVGVNSNISLNIPNTIQERMDEAGVPLLSVTSSEYHSHV